MNKLIEIEKTKISDKKNRVIDVKKLKKSYGDLMAVNGLDFYVEKGSLFSFLGVNGAGKSTTIDIISTILKPDSGNVLIDGYRLGKEDDKIREIIGIVFQEGVLDPLLTVKENLMARGRFYGLKGKELQEEVLKSANMTHATEFIDRQYGKLSGGQRRRADIARALINTPKILFLDEPTTGLDPQTRKDIWKMIKKLQIENDMTVFLTTHYMEEAAESDYITIIGSGEIITKGTPSELKEKYSKSYIKIKDINEEKIITKLQKEKPEYYVKNGWISIQLKETKESIDIIKTLDKKDIDGIEVINGTMDDVFLNVAGKGEGVKC